MWWLWIALAAGRLLWTVVGQTGYIHPDEFFQSVEVVAGDVFDIEAVRTWEFNSTLPIRSIVLPYIIAGPSLYTVKRLQRAGLIDGDDPLTPSSYWLLMGPRVTVALLSLFTDWLVLRTCQPMGVSGKKAVSLWASSYVTLVFLTRTFSNTFEAFLMSCLMCLTLTRNSDAKSTPKEAQQGASGQRQGLQGDQGRTKWICLVLVAGLFNRPTFLAFAAVPYLFWLCPQRMGRFYWHSQSLHIILGKLVETVLWCGAFSAAFIFCDSLYYRGWCPNLLGAVNNTATLHEVLYKDMVITPLNFIVYNLQSSNLAEHGIHPRFTHALVNLPMLLGLYAVVFYWNVLQVFISREKRKKIRLLDATLMASVLVPLVVLSVFPHQEARFLLPLVHPVLLLSCRPAFTAQGARRPMLVLWAIFNVFGASLFGCLHQGGVTSSLGDVQRVYNQQHRLLFAGHHQPVCSSYRMHAVFYHTYMPPRHLLAIPKTNAGQDVPSNDASSLRGAEITDANLLVLHDVKGGSTEELSSTMKGIIRDQNCGITDTACCEILIILPSTLLNRVYPLWSRLAVEASVIARARPHLSFEDLPDWGKLMDVKRPQSHPSTNGTIFQGVPLNWLQAAFDELSLAILKLNPSHSEL